MLHNLLYNIKETVKPWITETRIDRRTQINITRLRIGHTLVTHGHLMNLPRTDPASCSNCNIELTVNHIIQDCPYVRAQRMSTIGPHPINEILGPKVRIISLMKYLKSVQVHDVI